MDFNEAREKALKGQDAETTLEKIAYEQMCQQFGLKPEWLGKTFVANGRTYTIVGLNVRSKKFPVRTVSANSDGLTGLKTYWNATHVAGYMGGNLDSLLEDAAAKSLEGERSDYKKLAVAFGLKPEWLDRQFVHRGTKVTIAGLAPNRRRFSVVGKNARGRIAYYPADYVQREMTKAESVAA